MTPFEDELRKALGRHETSRDFTAQLFKKIEQQERGARSRSAPRSNNSLTNSLTQRWMGWRLQWTLAALLLIVTGSGTVAYREHLRVERGEAAKQQLLVAMRITSKQLRAAQTRVREIEGHELVMR
ncbi:MAG TPA: hypothetical protein VHZ55_15835 [Bryobacteraceae bacterium]|jgi:hypothetical protein|nr:hypothetical protein [Bryobacteraceae bacterium]